MFEPIQTWNQFSAILDKWEDRGESTPAAIRGAREMPKMAERVPGAVPPAMMYYLPDGSIVVQHFVFAVNAMGILVFDAKTGVPKRMDFNCFGDRLK